MGEPLLLVTKKDGSFQLCGNYRQINNVMDPNRYPLLYPQEFTTNFASKIVFSKLDFVRVYHQVPIAATKFHKSAVLIPFELDEFPVMCSGFYNAVQTFQRLVN